MEVKIGIADSNRELVFKTGMEPDDVRSRVETALTADAKAILELEDEKGRRYLVSTERVAYVEIGETARRPVGFLSNRLARALPAGVTTLARDLGQTAPAQGDRHGHRVSRGWGGRHPASVRR